MGTTLASGLLSRRPNRRQPTALANAAPHAAGAPGAAAGALARQAGGLALGVALCALSAAAAAQGTAQAAVPPATPMTPLTLVRPPAAQAAAALPRPVGCLIEPDRIAEVGTPVVGVIERFEVDRGDLVKAGQPLVRLRAGVERANHGVAEERVRIDSDVRAALAAHELAQQKVERAEQLIAENFLSPQALEQAKAEAEVARQKVAQAQGQQSVWRRERDVAEAQLEQRTLRSPFEGVVAERYMNPGERAEERPLLRIAVIDPLRVELMVPVAQFGSFAPGDAVVVQPELPDAPPVTARVRQVDRLMDAASNTFRVRLTLPNPQLSLPAGLRCKVELPARVAQRAAR